MRLARGREKCGSQLAARDAVHPLAAPSSPPCCSPPLPRAGGAGAGAGWRGGGWGGFAPAFPTAEGRAGTAPPSPRPTGVTAAAAPLSLDCRCGDGGVAATAKAAAAAGARGWRGQGQGARPPSCTPQANPCGLGAQGGPTLPAAVPAREPEAAGSSKCSNWFVGAVSALCARTRRRQRSPRPPLPALCAEDSQRRVMPCDALVETTAVETTRHCVLEYDAVRRSTMPRPVAQGIRSAARRRRRAALCLGWPPSPHQRDAARRTRPSRGTAEPRP